MDVSLGSSLLCCFQVMYNLLTWRCSRVCFVGTILSLNFIRMRDHRRFGKFALVLDLDWLNEFVFSFRICAGSGERCVTRFSLIVWTMTIFRFFIACELLKLNGSCEVERLFGVTHWLESVWTCVNFDKVIVFINNTFLLLCCCFIPLLNVLRKSFDL